MQILGNPNEKWQSQKQILEEISSRINDGNEEILDFILTQGKIFSNLIYNLRSAFVGLVCGVIE